MQFSDLTIFLTVVQEGSCEKAGIALSLSASSVQRHIVTLEKTLGVPLFIRRGRRLVLTENALAFIPPEIHLSVPKVKVSFSLPHPIPSGHTIDEGQLWAFVLSADSGTFRRAALQLFLTGTAVSKQIRRLEHSLGFPLFERINGAGGGIVLTEEGRHFYKCARELLQEITDVRIALAAHDRMEGTRLTIALSMYRPAGVESFWAALSKQFEDRLINILPIGDSLEDFSSAAKRLGPEIDLLPGLAGIDLMRDRFDFLPVCEVPWVAYVPRGGDAKEIRSNPSLTSSDLPFDHCILLRQGLSQDSLLPSQGMEQVGWLSLSTLSNAYLHKKWVIAPDLYPGAHPMMVAHPIADLPPAKYGFYFLPGGGSSIPKLFRDIGDSAADDR